MALPKTSARLGVLRLNAGRLNYAQGRTAVGIWINGVNVRARVRVGSLAIRDLLANTPNTCRMVIEGPWPSLGHDVRIGLGDMSAPNILFGGRIDTVDSLYEARPGNRVFAITCQDYTLGLNRRKVRIRYGQMGAHLIALDLLARYAPAGYSGEYVVQPLPTVEGGIDFTEEDLTACFSRLATRIGGYWYVDYEKRIHLFLTETTEAPDPIITGGRQLLNEPPITVHSDATQIRTRVWVEGGGSVTRAPVAPGATSIPVTDASWYSGTGGYVVSGPQRIHYTGKGLAGGPAAPTATIDLTPGNLTGGPYSYKYAHVSGSEGALGAVSNAVTIAGPAVPPATFTLATIRTYLAPPDYVAQSMNAWVPGSLLPGTYYYVLTYVDSSGHQTSVSPPAGPFSGGAQTCDVEFRNFRSSDAYDDVVNMYLYRKGGPAAEYQFVAPMGKAQAYYRDSTTYPGGWPPPASNETGSGGGFAPGTYSWVVTFTMATGETAPSAPVTYQHPAGYMAATLAGLPTSTDARVTGRKVYRTKRNTPGVYYLEATIANTTATTLQVGIPDASLGAALVPAAPVTGRVTLSNIAAGPGGTTARRVYRTTAGGSSYRLLVVLGDNTTTTYLDNVADAALGDVAAGEAITELVGIPASGDESIRYAIPMSQDVNLLVRVDAAAAQAQLAALEGAPSDGILEHYIQDRRLALAMAAATGWADLVLFAYPIHTLTYATRDLKTRSGKSISVNLPPLSLQGTFTIQTVTIDEINIADTLAPRYTVEASTVRFSLEDVLRRLQLQP